jgi:hypothetical protein
VQHCAFADVFSVLEPIHALFRCDATLPERAAEARKWRASVKKFGEGGG